MTHHTPPDLDPKQIEEAKTLWRNFTIGGKYSIYATAIILILLALGFVKFF